MREVIDQPPSKGSIAVQCTATSVEGTRTSRVTVCTTARERHHASVYVITRTNVSGPTVSDTEWDELRWQTLGVSVGKQRPSTAPPLDVQVYAQFKLHRCRLRRVTIYETAGRFYLVGCDVSGTRFKVLKIDRIDSKAMLTGEPECDYSKDEILELLATITEGS
ncbi:unnamed protein product [Nippostrongylus brasiliensis]|uniref:Polyphosphoinositide phosphatase (inferred by orthology to a human protein) n=1 Tax=Nippostrongylus brasiliensis TaxID=27835 RepID=A0A0N4YC68_NIPBR|nr:unnamed protein product [Nippostrongylus brasiliensis]